MIIKNIENLFIAKLFSLISLVFFATFSYSHEMWLEANSFQIDTNDVLEVNIKIGEKLQGSNLPYIPNSIEEFYWSQNGVKNNIKSRLGDIPAFTKTFSENGLTSIVYISKPSIITYETFQKFEKFAVHKDLGPVKKLHLNYGFPEKYFKETYSRFAKVIVGIGSSSGKDSNFGLLTEFILLNNPYTDKSQNFVKLKLNYQGNPRSNAQVMVFERSLDNTVSIFTTKTSKDGIIKIPVKKGYDYLFDAVKLRKANPSSKQKSVWETLWAALMIKIPQ